MAHQGTRGTDNFSAGQRPGAFGRGVKLLGSRVGRKDAKKHLTQLRRRRKR